MSVLLALQSVDPNNRTGTGAATATLAATGAGSGTEQFNATGAPSYALVASGSGAGTEIFNGTGAPTATLSASGTGLGTEKFNGTGAPTATLAATGLGVGLNTPDVVNVTGSGAPTYSLIANGEGAGTMTADAVAAATPTVGGRHRFYVAGEKEPKKVVSETASPTEPLIVAVGLPEAPADPVYIPAQPGSKALEKVLEPILAQSPAPQRRKGLKDEELIYMIMAGAA